MKHIAQEPNPILQHIEKMLDACIACLPRQTPSLKALQEAQLIAHRGAHDKNLLIIENTDKAFQHALSLGCYGIELDIHSTKDNVLIVNHDPTLKRLWGKDITIRDTKFDHIRKIVPEIPSLEEVVSSYGKKLHLFIELKSPFDSIDALNSVLTDLTPSEDYHLISLDEEILPKLDMFPKNALLLVPTHNNVKKFCKLSLSEQYGGVLGHYLLFHDKLVRQLSNAHQLTGVGFVDSRYSLYRELNRGLRFLFTNKAAKVASYLKRNF